MNKLLIIIGWIIVLGLPIDYVISIGSNIRALGWSSFIGIGLFFSVFIIAMYNITIHFWKNKE